MFSACSFCVYVLTNLHREKSSCFWLLAAPVRAAQTTAGLLGYG